VPAEPPLTPAFSSDQLNYTVRYAIPQDATAYSFPISAIPTLSDSQVGFTGQGDSIATLDERTVIFNEGEYIHMTTQADPWEYTVTIRVCDPGYSPTGLYIGVTDYYKDYTVTFQFVPGWIGQE